MRAVLDRFGRVILPKSIRDDLGLKPGSALDLEVCRHEVRLRPIEGEPDVALKDGVLVFSGVGMGEITGAVRVHRRERIHKIVRHLEK